MASSKNNSREKRPSGFPPADEPTPQKRSTASEKAPGRWGLKIMFLVVAIGGTYLAMWMKPGPDVQRLTYKVVNTYPHDTSAFTQGLLYDDGFLYESTGKKGQSSLRKVELNTGVVLKQHNLPDDVFAEGLALADDKFYQLTWQNNVIYVYDRDFNELKKVDYPHQGWGLTFDGTHLIASDGTRMLYFLDPETLEEVKQVKIHMSGRSVGNVNEMENFGEDIYANVYMRDELYWIDKNTGKVRAIVDLSGLWPRSQRKGRDEVLNGIAIDHATKRIWVTGKNAPHVWEIELTEKRK
jgi:glutamine cyclotransferase